MPSGPTQRDSMLDAAEDQLALTAFPACSYLATEDQIRSFELLRLAYFALKLRKLERLHSSTPDSEYAFHCNLLRHVIFQQVVSLSALNVGAQAMQLITACHSAR